MMMTPPLALGQEIYSQGFRLSPTPQEAVGYYLRRLVSGEPLHEVVRPVIHHADVYGCDPADLARRFRPMPRTDDRFFFAPRKTKAARATSSPGSWAAQSTVEIKRDGVLIGELRKMRFKKRGVFTDWLMDEYSSSSSSCGGDKQQHQQQFVFCKVYVSPRAAPTSAARHESAAFFALPPLQPATPAAIIAQPAAKRKAPPQAAMPPCAKRMRGPVLQPAPQPPAPIRSPLTAAQKLFFAPPQPWFPLRGSPAPSVTHTQPSPDPIHAPPPPVPTRRSPMPAPPRPKQQATPPVAVVHASCHMPRQALPPPPCRPQVSVQPKQRRILDPFQAAIMREQAQEQTVAAPPDPSPSKQVSAAAPALQDDDGDDDDLVRELEDAMEKAEAEEQAKEQTVAAQPDQPPSKQVPAATPALQDDDDDDDDDLVKELEDAMEKAEAEEQAVAAALQEEEEDEDCWDDLEKALEF